MIFIRLLFTAAFALSSGTIGAALSSSLSKMRSIALSYGTVLRSTPATLHEPAHLLGSQIIRHLWDNWGEDAGGLRNGEVDLYNVNIPMIHELLSEEGLKICWAHLWRNSYGRLFKAQTPAQAAIEASAASPAGPDSPNEKPSANAPNQDATPQSVGKIVFTFSPDIGELINPSESSVPVGTDAWAFRNGWASVTPLRASFAEPSDPFRDVITNPEEKVWKMKL